MIETRINVWFSKCEALLMSYGLVFDDCPLWLMFSSNVLIYYYLFLILYFCFYFFIIFLYIYCFFFYWYISYFIYILLFIFLLVNVFLSNALSQVVRTVVRQASQASRQSSSAPEQQQSSAGCRPTWRGCCPPVTWPRRGCPTAFHPGRSRRPASNLASRSRALSALAVGSSSSSRVTSPEVRASFTADGCLAAVRPTATTTGAGTTTWFDRVRLTRSRVGPALSPRLKILNVTGVRAQCKYINERILPFNDLKDRYCCFKPIMITFLFDRLLSIILIQYEHVLIWFHYCDTCWLSIRISLLNSCCKYSNPFKAWNFFKHCFQSTSLARISLEFYGHCKHILIWIDNRIVDCYHSISSFYNLLWRYSVIQLHPFDIYFGFLDILDYIL